MVILLTTTRKTDECRQMTSEYLRKSGFARIRTGQRISQFFLCSLRISFLDNCLGPLVYKDNYGQTHDAEYEGIKHFLIPRGNIKGHSEFGSDKGGPGSPGPLHSYINRLRRNIPTIVFICRSGFLCNQGRRSRRDRHSRCPSRLSRFCPSPPGCKWR